MCTDRSGLVLLLSAIVTILPSAAHADEAHAAQWWTSESRVCLWIVADGLRADALDADAPWDGPLMPKTASRRETCLRLENVFAELTDSHASLGQLLGAKSPAQAWSEATTLDEFWLADSSVRRTRGVQATLTALEDAAASAGRWTIVATLDDLRFPLGLEAESLRDLDPRPWADAPSTPVEIEWIQRKRLRQAIEVATDPTPLRPRMSEHSLEIYRWVVDAGHRRLDASLERLFTRMDRADLAARGGWILSAPRALAVDRHGLDQPGRGAVVDRLHVPLWIHFPDAVDLHGRRGEAYTNRDLATTLMTWTQGKLGAGIFGPARHDRFAFASGERTLGRTTKEWAQLRWSNSQFTALDLVGTPVRMELYDRTLDPGELHARGAASQALWDSLRTEMISKLFGKSIVLEVTASDHPLQFDLQALPSTIEVLEGDPVELRPSGGGTRVHWAASSTASKRLRIRMPSDHAGLRLSRPALGTVRVRLAATVVALPVQGSLEIPVGSRHFVDMTRAGRGHPEQVPLPAVPSMRWVVSGWWAGR